MTPKGKGAFAGSLDMTKRSHKNVILRKKEKKKILYVEVAEFWLVAAVNLIYKFGTIKFGIYYLGIPSWVAVEYIHGLQPTA